MSSNIQRRPNLNLLVKNVALDNRWPHRRTIRLLDFDYAGAGAYFVTLCVQGRSCLFGSISGEGMRLNSLGCIAAACWQWLSQRYRYVDLDAWVVMPNHLHGVLVIRQESCGPTAAATRPLGALVGAFKVVSTRQINEARGCSGCRVWQRGYYERVVRGAEELDRIREYIGTNPANWAKDRERPENRLPRLSRAAWDQV